MPSAPLQTARAVPLVGHETLHRGEQKCPKSAALPVREFDVIPFEQSREKALGEILGVFRAVTASADVGIERIPISVTKTLQRLTTFRRRSVASRQHDAPMRRCERSRRGWSGHADRLE